MMLYSLVVVVHESRVEVSLYEAMADARLAAAKRVLRMLRESSAVDLGDDVIRMSEANQRGDYGEVVRRFERMIGRQVIFIQPVANPVPAVPPLALPV